MLQTVSSACLIGLEVVRVKVEVAITRGTPLIQIVGLAESAVREGRERIRAAAVQLGLHVPGLRITVNLAPADVRKHGAAFDLPIIVGILAAAGDVPGERARRYAMLGELGLAGDVRPVRGVLPIALHFLGAADVDGLIIPFANLGEARPVRGLEVLGAATLEEVIGFLRGARPLPTPGDIARNVPGRERSPDEPDLRDVHGQERAKRALEEYRVEGISTTLPFFRQVLQDPKFLAGEMDVGYIDRNWKGSAGGARPVSDPVSIPISINVGRDRAALIAAAVAAYRSVGRPRRRTTAKAAPSVWKRAGIREQHGSRL